MVTGRLTTVTGAPDNTAVAIIEVYTPRVAAYSVPVKGPVQDTFLGMSTFDQGLPSLLQ